MLDFEYTLEDEIEYRAQEAMRKGHEKGLEKGREEGREEGIEIGMLKAAKAMFNDGDSLEKIARNTGIPLESLKEKLFVQ